MLQVAKQKLKKATVEIKNGDAVVATETTDTDGVAKLLYHQVITHIQ